MTPRMTRHARERCAEMGISTKVAKRIVQRGEVHRPGTPGGDAVIATWTSEPRYAAVYLTDGDGSLVVVTVLFRTERRYARRGSTFSLPDVA